MHTPIPTLVGFTKTPWNKSRLIGQKRPLKPKEVWAIRVRLQLEQRRRDLGLFNLAIDSKLRGCDLVRLVVSGTTPSNPSLARSSSSMNASITRTGLFSVT